MLHVPDSRWLCGHQERIRHASRNFGGQGRFSKKGAQFFGFAKKGAHIFGFSKKRGTILYGAQILPKKVRIFGVSYNKPYINAVISAACEDLEPLEE